MVLSKLIPTAEPVAVQDTAFTTDVLGRFVCNTWGEATDNGGPPFTAVVVGAGAYGAYCAAKIHRRDPDARVLLLEAGSFLVPEHVQNLGRMGLGVPAEILPSQDPGTVRDHVWGMPWRGNVPFPGLAYCAGGKSLYWGGWCPRLAPEDLAQWPAAVSADLVAAYTRVESETGVVPGTEFIFGELHDALLAAVRAAAAGVPAVDTGFPGSINGVQEAPLAVQGGSPVSGLFSFDKYSSLPLLIDAIRGDATASEGSDSRRGLFLVPRAHVVRLHATDGVVHTVEVDVAGHREFLGIDPACSVVLAASAIETTRLALLSFPTELMGRNLMAHSRSDFTVRIHRSVLPPLPALTQSTAMLVRGQAPTGRFHVQITGSASTGGSDEMLFRMIPDVEDLDAHASSADPAWITITLRAIGEMHGDRDNPVPRPGGSWINLSPSENDEFGVPRAFVQLDLDAADLATWDAMDRACVDLAQALAGNPDMIEYQYDGGWHREPFPLDRPFPPWHRGLGSTYHEAGTLWMGEDPGSSVTDVIGRFHEVRNAYACDQSVFPTVGSVNPVLTGLTLASRLADHLTA